MKNYLIILFVFISFIAFAYSGLFEYDLLGGTQLNGAGCVCHTVEQDTTVSVWIEGPDTLMAGETGIYRMFLANGPAQAGGYNVAGRFGTMVLVDSFSVGHPLSPNELTQAFSLPFPTQQDTVYWEFGYTAPDSLLTDTLYSCGLSLVWDTIPDFHDRWNFGPKFPIVVVENTVPVELISFSAFVEHNNVTLNWITSTETNNREFEIERFKDFKIEDIAEWKTIGFVQGNGTTTKTNSYAFIDKNLSVGKFLYRLKQIDFDGSYSYSQIVEVEMNTVTGFALEQNFPNPFNPTTKIQFSTASKQLITLIVYDVLGNQVATLVNEEKTAGNYEIIFDAKNIDLPSGVYFYKLNAGNFSETKKLILMK